MNVFQENLTPTIFQNNFHKTTKAQAVKAKAQHFDTRCDL